MLAGRPHEAAGNGSPRWMTAVPRERGTEPGLQVGSPALHAADLRLAEALATEVIQASTDFDGTERAPRRLAEARITLGVVAARQGDLEQVIHYGQCALTAPRKSVPSLLMISRDPGTR